MPIFRHLPEANEDADRPPPYTVMRRRMRAKRPTALPVPARLPLPGRPGRPRKPYQEPRGVILQLVARLERQVNFGLSKLPSRAALAHWHRGDQMRIRVQAALEKVRADGCSRRQEIALVQRILFNEYNRMEIADGTLRKLRAKLEQCSGFAAN